MTPAAAIIGRLTRLLLLACTVLGVAALHTIGHAAAGDTGQHTTVASSAVSVASIVPVDTDGHGGCDGDGCDHQSITPSDAHDNSRMWDVCVAVLSVLALGLLAAATSSAHIGLARTRWTRWRPPPLLPHRRVGLALTTVAVLRT